MNNQIEYLENAITDGMTLEDIIDVFEQFCQPLDEEDTVLFETGIFSFTGEKLFYFSLVKQFPNGDEEYNQIHVDVLYKPNKENRRFRGSVWDEDLDENIFDYIKKSKAYEYAQNNDYIKVEIYMDET